MSQVPSLLVKDRGLAVSQRGLLSAVAGADCCCTPSAYLYTKCPDAPLNAPDTLCRLGGDDPFMRIVFEGEPACYEFAGVGCDAPDDIQIALATGCDDPVCSSECIPPSGSQCGGISSHSFVLSATLTLQFSEPNCFCCGNVISFPVIYTANFTSDSLCSASYNVPLPQNDDLPPLLVCDCGNGTGLYVFRTMSAVFFYACGGGPGGADGWQAITTGNWLFAYGIPNASVPGGVEQVGTAFVGRSLEQTFFLGSPPSGGPGGPYTLINANNGFPPGSTIEAQCGGGLFPQVTGGFDPVFASYNVVA